MMNYYDSFDCQIQCEEYYNENNYGLSCYNANEDYMFFDELEENGFYEGGF